MLRNVFPFEDRDTWIAAYAAWYQHFRAMQPRMGQLAEKWAQEMTENTLTHFHLRDDQQEIVQLAMREIGKEPLMAGSEKPLAGCSPLPECSPLAGNNPLAEHEPADRFINSSDLVAAYNQYPTISNAIATRLGDMLHDGEPQTVAALARIIAEELHGEPGHPPLAPFPTPAGRPNRPEPRNATEGFPGPAPVPRTPPPALVPVPVPEPAPVPASTPPPVPKNTSAQISLF